MVLARNKYGSVDIRDGLLPAGFVLLDELPASEFDLSRLGVEFAPALLGFRDGRPIQSWLVASDWAQQTRSADMKLARELLRVRIIKRGRRLGMGPAEINQVLRQRGYDGPDDQLAETGAFNTRKHRARG